MLGKEQWARLENILSDASSNFTIVVSGIQVLTTEFRGKEVWQDMKKERTKLLELIKGSNRKILIASGDRHYSEFSQFEEFFEFTASGMTHVKKT